MSLIFADGTLQSVTSLANKKIKDRIISSYANSMIEDFYEHQLFTPENKIHNNIKYILSRDENGLYTTQIYLSKKIMYSPYFKHNDKFTIKNVCKQSNYNIITIVFDKCITFRHLAMFLYHPDFMFEMPQLFESIIQKPIFTYDIVNTTLIHILDKI